MKFIIDPPIPVKIQTYEGTGAVAASEYCTALQKASSLLICTD